MPLALGKCPFLLVLGPSSERSAQLVVHVALSLPSDLTKVSPEVSTPMTKEAPWGVLKVEMSPVTSDLSCLTFCQLSVR